MGDVDVAFARQQAVTSLRRSLSGGALEAESLDVHPGEILERTTRERDGRKQRHLDSESGREGEQ